MLLDGENQKTVGTESYNLKHRSSSKWNDDLSTADSTITESLQTGEFVNGSSCGSKVCSYCNIFLCYVIILT